LLLHSLIHLTGFLKAAENKLPDLSVGRITEKQIKSVFEHLRNPDLQTDFD
jgi:hypothetical protein